MWRARRAGVAALALGLLPVSAEAERPLSASLRGGMAIYPSEAVASGPALGLQASAGLTSQLSFVFGASGSRHDIAARSGGGTLDVLQLGAGFSFLLDDAPLLPYVHAGVMSAWRDTARAHDWGPWPYLGFELVLPLRAPLTVGVDARYAVQLESGLAQFGYLQLGLEVGVASGPGPP